MPNPEKHTPEESEEGSSTSPLERIRKIGLPIAFALGIGGAPNMADNPEKEIPLPETFTEVLTGARATNEHNRSSSKEDVAPANILEPGEAALREYIQEEIANQGRQERGEPPAFIDREGIAKKHGVELNELLARFDARFKEVSRVLSEKEMRWKEVEPLALAAEEFTRRAEEVKLSNEQSAVLEREIAAKHGVTQDQLRSYLLKTGMKTT